MNCPIASWVPEASYQALQARDERFNGRCFVGVTATGIYCRPICRVRTPLRKNCQFFATDIALASGCGSNAYRASPDEEAVTAKRAYRPPFDVPAVLVFVAIRAIPWFECVDRRKIRRSLRGNSIATDSPGWLEAEFSEHAPVGSLRYWSQVTPRLAPGSSPDALIDNLRRLPGVSPWAARCIAMRALNWPDALFPRDAAVLQAMHHFWGTSSPRDAEAQAPRWQPWRSYAALRLWNALEEASP